MAANIEIGSRYHQKKRIGGGMADVHEAFDTKFQRKVAIKTVRRDMNY